MAKPLEISITNELFPMPPEDKFMNGIIESPPKTST